jgi:hypothetical protein
MNYEKYLKYKKKYIDLKTKSLQFGGGAKCIHNRYNAKNKDYTILRVNPTNDNDFVNDSTGKQIYINELEEVDVLDTQVFIDPTDQTKTIYGRIIKNGKSGWVNMSYLQFRHPILGLIPCQHFKPTPPKVVAFPPLPSPPLPSPLHPKVVAFPPLKVVASPPKTKWGCHHHVCNVLQPHNPLSVCVIVKNIKNQILVSTENDKNKKGYYLVNGSIDDGNHNKVASCPVYTSYDETAEESRLLPADNSHRATGILKNFKGERIIFSHEGNWKEWNNMFKPDGQNYIIPPWYDARGRCAVFVADIGQYYYDANNPPVGDKTPLSSLNDLTHTFTMLRAVPGINSKYTEKLHFKWVQPLNKGNSDAEWSDWTQQNNMNGWASSIIRQYIERS